MTPKELDTLSHMITEALKPHIEDRVHKAIQEIPFMVRREIHLVAAEEVREVVRRAVEENVFVTLKVKKDE